MAQMLLGAGTVVFKRAVGEPSVVTASGNMNTLSADITDMTRRVFVDQEKDEKVVRVRRDDESTKVMRGTFPRSQTRAAEIAVFRIRLAMEEYAALSKSSPFGLWCIHERITVKKKHRKRKIMWQVCIHLNRGDPPLVFGYNYARPKEAQELATWLKRSFQEESASQAKARRRAGELVVLLPPKKPPLTFMGLRLGLPELRVGMSQDDVQVLLGEPVRVVVVPPEGTEYWYYNYFHPGRRSSRPTKLVGFDTEDKTLKL